MSSEKIAGVPGPASHSDSDGVLVSAGGLGKVYHLYDRPQDRLKQAFLWGKKQLYREFWALRDISFEVRRGETLGVIGRNGAGKSTLLQLLAGTLAPTLGEVQVKGRMAALLELGSGFNPEFTGRENVYLNGAILGFNRQEMNGRFDEIAAFADIGNFMEQPVKLYSSGMIVRLAFAVQVCLDLDVLIVDEVLAVGDIFFRQKCHERMEKLLTRGTAIVLVSHDMNVIQKYSTQTMLLDRGRCLFAGQPNLAVSRYYQLEHGFDPNPVEAPIDATQPGSQAASFEPDAIPDWPASEVFLNLSQADVVGEEQVARCSRVALCDAGRRPCSAFQIGDMARFYFEFQLLQDIAVPIGGVVVTNRLNVNVHGKNSLQYWVKAPPVARKGALVRFRQTMELLLAPGEYVFMVGLSTMGAADYARLPDMDSSEIIAKQRSILRVKRAGSFWVRPPTSGPGLPFYGCADLKGDSILSVLQP